MDSSCTHPLKVEIYTMDSSAIPPLKLPQVNLSSKLQPRTEEWAGVRSQLMQSLETYGCVEIVSDKLTEELREAIFGRAVKDLFGLPVETKMLNNKGQPHQLGYIANFPGLDIYESLLIAEPTDPNRVHEFATLMWGEKGNPAFWKTQHYRTLNEIWKGIPQSDAIFNFVTLLKELDEMVMKMVFEALGVSKYLHSHLESLDQSLRLSHYRAPKTRESTPGLGIHTDLTSTSIVCQHEQEGLQILTKDGSWITPSRNSLVFLVGDVLSAWSNERLEAVIHRVQVVGDEDRYSTNYSCNTKDGILVEAPQELVDEEHPLLFKPFYHKDYIQFRFSEPGLKAESPLKAFHGLKA